MAIPFRAGLRSEKTLITKNRQRATLHDFRFWLGFILVLGSATIGARLIASASHRVPAVVAVNSLAAGSTLTAEDLEIVSVAIPDSVLVSSSTDALVGKVLAQPLISGALVPPGAVADSTAFSTRTIALPVRAGHLPNVDRGALVDVWVTPSLDGVATPGPATRIVSDALVANVPVDIDPTSDSRISLQVPSDSVQSLVQAMRDGLIDIVVVAGAAS